MIIVRIIGGLGNQMFQYAFYKRLKEKYGDVKCDINGYENYKLHTGFELENIFDVKIEKATLREIEKCTTFYNRNLLSRITRKIFGNKKTHIEEKDFSWDIIDAKQNLFLDGYWQSEQYFGDNKALREDFKFKNQLSVDDELEKIVNSSSSVSLHVRRGDYVGNTVYAQLDESYYASAMEMISKQVENPVFLVFSDDLNWAENSLLASLKLKYNIVFFKTENGSPMQDLQTMARCRHNIIANSSFSWWGAWLNNNSSKIVVYPNRWYTDPKTNSEHIAQMPKDWFAVDQIDSLGFK